jgi:ABC-type lipopolysaccharide export system ATPase subunit
MKSTEPILKNETADMGAHNVEQARHLVAQKEQETMQAEREAQELNELLMEIQLEQQEKETAEAEGQEKERQIEGVAER